MDVPTPHDTNSAENHPRPPEGQTAPDRPVGLHQLVLDGFAELGIPTPCSITRSLLICDRQLVGQRFCCEGGQALWRAAQSVLEFYDLRGQLRKTVPVDHYCAVRDAA